MTIGRVERVSNGQWVVVLADGTIGRFKTKAEALRVLEQEGAYDELARELEEWASKQAATISKD
jgi:hypothetical protein